MNKIKFLFIFIILLAIAVLILNIQYFMSHHKYLLKIKSQFDKFLYKYKNFDDELPVIIHQNNNNPCINAPSIDKDKAMEDVEYLFSLLKFGYSGYEFFGGDDTFIPAKKNIFWSVIATRGNDICIRTFLNIINSELDFIQDSHLKIGNYKLCKYTKYFSSRKLTFHKDNIGFYTVIDGVNFYLEKVNNEDP